MLTYTGIGSTKTPKDVQVQMTTIAKMLEELQFTLLSGSAPGADSAFELGSKTKQIFLPWKGFNDSHSPLHVHGEDAYEVASKFHPIWDNLRPGQKKFHVRNVKQVLGGTCDKPTEFLVCWTPDGIENDQKTTRKTGGSGQAIRIAQHYKVPIFNLKNEGRYQEFIEFLNKNYK